MEMRDDRDLAEKAVRDLLKAHPDLVALYNAGAGNQGVAAALKAARKMPRLVFVAHELTALSRELLIAGTADAVIAQNPGHEARSAARLLLSRGIDEAIIAEQERIRIDIFLRENLP
jgi:LacI family transcriptional regulator